MTPYGTPTRVAGSRFLSLAALAVLVFVLAAGREKRAAAEQPADLPIRFNLSRIESEVGRRVEGVFRHPAVDKALDAFLAAVVADPKLHARGQRLFETLAADPEIAKSVQGLLGRLAATPEMRTLVLDLLRQNPRKSPDEIGAIAGELVGKRFETRAGAAFEEVVIGKLDTQRNRDLVAKALGDRIDRITRYFNDPAKAAAWNKRLVELNGGKMPDPERAADLLVANLFSEARLEKCIVTLLANKTVRADTAKFLDQLLAIDAVAAELHRSAAKIAGDGSVQDAAIKTMTLLIASKPDPAALKIQVHRLLGGPVVVGSVERLANIVLTDPKVVEIVRQRLDHIGADPALCAAVDELFAVEKGEKKQAGKEQ